MEKNRHLILGVAIAVMVAAGGYAACGMQVEHSEADLTATDPPPSMDPDAGMWMDPPPPVVDDPEFDPSATGNTRPELGTMPGEPRPVAPPATPTLDLPEEETQVGAANLGRIACGGAVCAAGEMCCAPEARCVPEDCPECCNGEDDRPGPAEIVPPEMGLVP